MRVDGDAGTVTLLDEVDAALRGRGARATAAAACGPSRAGPRWPSALAAPSPRLAVEATVDGSDNDHVANGIPEGVAA